MSAHHLKCLKWLMLGPLSCYWVQLWLTFCIPHGFFFNFQVRRPTQMKYVFSFRPASEKNEACFIFLVLGHNSVYCLDRQLVPKNPDHAHQAAHFDIYFSICIKFRSISITSDFDFLTSMSHFGFWTRPLSLLLVIFLKKTSFEMKNKECKELKFYVMHFFFYNLINLTPNSLSDMTFPDSSWFPLLQCIIGLGGHHTVPTRESRNTIWSGCGQP